MSTSEVLTLIVLAATLIGVLWYASEARKQAKASLQMAAEMKRSRQDSVRPVLNIAGELPSSLRDTILELQKKVPAFAQVVLKNIGVGPALHIQFTFYRDDGEPSPLLTIGAIEAGMDYFGAGQLGDPRLSPLRLPVTTTEDGGHQVAVTYKDVYGIRWESIRELSYVEAVSGYQLGPLIIRRIGD